MGAARRIRVLGLGTYYKSKAEGPPPDADQLRKLAWHVKAKWTLGPVRMTYPGSPPALLWNQTQACEFVADVWANVWEHACGFLEVPADGQVDLVPVPSSEVTRSTLRTARWGAEKLALALQRRKLGTVQRAVVNAAATQPSHEATERQTAREIRANYEVIAVPQRAVLYVDDIFTQGRHVAAIDDALGRPSAAGMLVVGFTDNDARTTCLDVRAKVLEYADIDTGIRVTESE